MNKPVSALTVCLQLAYSCPSVTRADPFIVTRPKASTWPFIDIFTWPPVNGVYLAGGPYLSVRSSGGHVQGDSMRASLALPTTTLFGPERQESALWIDLRSPIGTGAVNSYAPNKAYSSGEFIQSNDASQIYMVTRGGISGSGTGPDFCPAVAHNANECLPGQPNLVEGTDGTLQLTWYRPGADNGKSAMLVSHEVEGGAHSWLAAYDLTIKTFPRVGGSAINQEIDTLNNVRDCPPFVQGECAVTAMWINGGNVNYPNSFGLWINGGISAHSPKGSSHVAAFIAPHSAIDVGLFEQSGATIGTRERGINSQASLLNDSVSPLGHQLAGTYSSAAIDTSNATTPFFENAASGQKLSFANHTANWAYRDGSMTYDSVTRQKAFSISNQGDIEFAGVLRPLGDAPTLSSCGEMASISPESNNTSGIVYVGAGVVTKCQINLATGYPSASYHCVISAANTIAARPGVEAYVPSEGRSVTKWIIAGINLDGAAFNYVCM